MVVLAVATLALWPVAARAAGPFQERVHPAGSTIPVGMVAVKPEEPKRLVAATLALTLGAFGAHRLYLGTEAKVPVIYGLTFGGFGVLVLIDLGHILFTKDLQAYLANGQVLMWAKGRPHPLTPP